MLMDALLSTTNLANATALTTLAAGTPGFSDVIDLSTSRDIATSKVPVSVQWTTLPTSATGGATVNVAVQTSADNVTWTTLEETAPQPLTSFAAGTNQWAFRGWLNAGVLRYLRFAYTASATLTAGSLVAQIGGDWPRSKTYPRNYVA